MGRLLLAIALPAISAACAQSPVLAAEPNRPAVEAAMGIWGYITAAEAEIGQCREIDANGTASYDRVYAAYHQSVGELLIRIDLLLTGEAVRAGAQADFFTGQLPKFAEAAVREAKRMATTNPAGFLDMCRHLPRLLAEHRAIFQSPREKWPDDMRLIDEWR